MRPLGPIIPCLASLLLAIVASSCTTDDDGHSLRFWAMGNEAEAARAIVPEFERTHPGVKVNVQQIPWSAAHEKLMTAYVGGTLPDVFQLGNTWIPELALLGALAPVDRHLESSSDLRRDDFFAGILDTNIIDGATMAVPWYVDTRLLFYRKSIWRRAGIEAMPATWTAWVDAAKQLKRVAPETYPLFLVANEWQPLAILGFQAGSPLLAANDSRSAFATPAFRRALDFYLAIFRDSLAPHAGEAQLANLYQEFGTGRVATLLSGPWSIGELERRLPPDVRDDWATAPLPSLDGRAPGTSTAGGASLAIAATSHEPDLAWDLVRFLLDAPQQLALYDRVGDLPSRRSSWVAGNLNQLSHIAAFRAQLENVRGTPKIPEWEQIANKLMEHTELTIRGEVDIDTTLATLDREVDALLAKRRAMRPE